MKKFSLILGGIVLIALGAAGIIMWWWDELYVVVRGAVGLCVVLTGIILIAAGSGTAETPSASEVEKEEVK